MRSDEAHLINASTASGPYIPLRLMLFTAYCYLVLIILLASRPGTVSGLDTPTSAISRCPTAPVTHNIVATKEQADLKVLVPKLPPIGMFVNCSDPTSVRGFCIDVFEKALSILSIPPSFSIHYSCFDFTSSTPDPMYDDMVNDVAKGTFDVVVGDVTIGANRLSMVDFTHKYMESGVVILTKVATEEVSQWLFFGSPFSWRLWCTIVGALAATSCWICYLEKDHHRESSRGHILWFSLEALVLLERESVKSATGRFVMLAWFCFVVLLTANYTAGLSSFLTAQSLSPPIQDISSLRHSGQKIGYLRNSIVKDYLTQRFHLPEDQLVPLSLGPQYINNLTRGPKRGGVVAIVDELPYVNIMLSALPSSICDSVIVSRQLTQEAGFGFGFNKDQMMVVSSRFSVALMNLTESGCLQELQDKAGISSTSKCSTTNAPKKVAWKSSISLFGVLLVFVSIAVFVHCAKKYCVPPLHSH